ncbi:MAG TPA: DUF1735 domain-containing protein [Ferruginibacter sp.]|nr:DUF1735 domain-containing protein [Ferruginibacter sp.]
MKKLLAILAIVAFITFGCKKNEYIKINDTDKSTVVFAENGGAVKSFPKISYVPDGSLADEYISFDSYTIRAKLDGPIVAPADITLTYSIDAAGLAKFNAEGAASSTTWVPYELMPANAYSLLVTTDVIKKGEVYASNVVDNIVTHPNLLDPAKFYLLPIKVTSSNPAFPASTTSGTIYFYVIGNPLAGSYQATGYFYHPTGPRAFTEVKAAIPFSPTELLVFLGDLGTSGYIAKLSTDPVTNKVTISAAPGATGGPYTQFDDVLPTTNPGYTTVAPGFAGPANFYNPLTKTFWLRYGYMGAGGWRVTEEKLVKL